MTRKIVSLVFAVFLMAIFGPLAFAQPPALPPGKIIYSSPMGGENWNLWVVNLSTYQQQQLTSHPDREVLPAWSPDGKRVVFSTNRDHPQYNSLYTMSSGGGSAERLTTPPWAASDGPASWGQGWIYFVRDVYDNPRKSGVYRIKPDGTGEQQLVSDYIYNLDVSPDGQRVAYVLTTNPTTNRRDIIIRSVVDSSSPITVTSAFTATYFHSDEPSWETNSSLIFMVSGGQLWRADLDGGTYQLLSTNTDMNAPSAGPQGWWAYDEFYSIKIQRGAVIHTVSMYDDMPFTTDPDWWWQDTTPPTPTPSPTAQPTLTATPIPQDELVHLPLVMNQ